jgi:Fe-S cluster assembly ATP-binding protein
MSDTLEIKDLHVSVEGKQILKGLDLSISQGDVHAVMGPNGSGKSTLAYSIMGHPKYKIDKGDIKFNGKSILKKSPDLRSQLGLFLAFQYPVSVAGLKLFNFLRAAYNSTHSTDKSKPTITILEFRDILKNKLEELNIDQSFAQRYLNEGFSGGEKKKCEILQMSLLQPKIAIMDETDSGLDIDALQVVAEGINNLSGPNLGILLITHYQRILHYIKPQYVHVIYDGKVVKSGGPELAEKLEEKGYSWITEKSKT